MERVVVLGVSHIASVFDLQNTKGPGSSEDSVCYDQN